MYLAAPTWAQFLCKFLWEMTDQLWVSVEVKWGLVSPTVLPATVEDTFGSLLDKVGNSKFIIFIMIFITL